MKDKLELRKQILVLIFAVTMLSAITVTLIYIKPTLTSTITHDKLVVQPEEDSQKVTVKKKVVTAQVGRIAWYQQENGITRGH